MTKRGSIRAGLSFKSSESIGESRSRTAGQPAVPWYTLRDVVKPVADIINHSLQHADVTIDQRQSGQRYPATVGCHRCTLLNFVSKGMGMFPGARTKLME